jgi:DNA topoisomerase-1
MKLVIVETPSQAKKLTDILGEGWRVELCSGLVRDLPTNQLGVEVDNDFHPTFAVVPGNGNLVRRLMKAIRESEAVYAATAPHREGEALAWHLLALSPDAKDKPIYRVLLHALTPDAIRAAFATPRPLDMQLIEANLTERIVDRLVGWSVNTAARKTLGFKTALSYDGMLALRLLAAKEAEITAFMPQPAWRTSVGFKHAGNYFTAHVMNAKGAPLLIANEEQIEQLETLLWDGTFWVDKTGQVMKTHPAPGTLTLRRLVETAAHDLVLPQDRILSLIETLYDAGWITHPDAELSVAVSEAAHAYIRRKYGTDYVATDAVVTSGIEPADVNRVPETLPGDGAALYALIWNHFIAAHMPPAQERLIGVRILVGASLGKPYPLELRTTAALPYFDSWRRVLPPVAEAERLPPLNNGDELDLEEILAETVGSEPPPRYTSASLMDALVNSGLTVQEASTAIEGVVTAEYVSGNDALTLTKNGRVLAGYLAAAFGDLTSPVYAAELKADIDRIAAGEQERLEVLHSFWARFGGTLRPTPAVRIAAEHKPIVLRPAEEV